MTQGAVDVSNLTGMLGCVVPVCAIPVLGGVFGLGLGMAGLVMGGRQTREALRHLGENEDTPWDELRVGAEVRVRGRVVPGQKVCAPMSGQEAVVVQMQVLRTTSNVGGRVEAWNDRRAVPFELEGDAITARVEASGASLLTALPIKQKWSGTAPEEVAAIVGNAVHRLDPTYRERGITREHDYTYVEHPICIGDDVTIAGRVDEATEERRAGDGYRDHQAAMRLQLTAAEITNLSDHDLQRRLRKGRTMFAGGAISLLLAIVNFALSVYWLLG